MKKTARKGFTLAEVLITLVIIGIVAVLTVPALIQQYKEKVTVTKVKKYAAIMNTAARLAVEFEGLENEEFIENEETAQLVGDKLKKYLNVIDDCGTAATCKNYKVGLITYLNGRYDPGVDFSKDYFYKMGMPDGVEVIIRASNNGSAFFVDVNGNKGPNTLGRDIFQLLGISPGHVTELSGWGFDIVAEGEPLWALCYPGVGDGWLCAGWIVDKGNMDYLRCPEELTWTGKTSCK